MPEAAIHKYGKTLLEKNEIGVAEEARVAAPAVNPVASENRNHRELRGLIVTVSYARHDLRAFVGGEYVSHTITSRRGLIS